jgi:hypothetical protein
MPALCERGKETAKRKFRVYPSAYANGYAVQVCRGTKPDYLGVYRDDYGPARPSDKSLETPDLDRWYRERWVNVCQRDSRGRFVPCGRSHARLVAADYPYCRPLIRLPGTPRSPTAMQLSEEEIRARCSKKHKMRPGPGGRPSRLLIK